MNGGSYSVAYDINAAGDVVVGFARDGAAGNAGRAFRWTQAGGLVSLGVLNAGADSFAQGINAGGDVVVGSARDGAAGNAWRAFHWAQATGMQSIEQWLAANGVSVDPAAPKTRIAHAVNADGNVVVGELDNNRAFLARVTPDSGGGNSGSGMIDLADYHQSLQGSAGLAMVDMQTADLVLHGAHGSPMRSLLPAGKQSFWLAGDWGRSDHRHMDDNAGAGEIGYGRSLADGTMLKIALGRTYAKQDTPFDGDTRIDGTYVLPELITRLPRTAVYATLSGYYHAGDARIDRGYANAGTPVISRGETDTETAGLRVRLDWLNAATFGHTAITPYASLTYLRAKVGSYTETGGGFPAYWESRTEDATQARLGVDVVHRLNDALNLLGRLEGAHRFEDEGGHAQGQVLGLFAFDLPGQSYKQNWLRAAVGVERKFRSGTGSLMLNATTEGDTPSYWLAASYRWTF